MDLPVTTNVPFLAQTYGTFNATNTKGKSFETGSYKVFVISDTSNVFGSGDLTFVISVSNDASSLNGLEHISMGDGTGFKNVLVNVGYGNDGNAYGTDAPVSADETIYGTVEFNFPGGSAIKAGDGSQYLVIQTNAKNFTFGNLGIIDSATATVDGYVPAPSMAETPEPSSLMLLGTGLIGGASTLLRRRRKSISL
jgi:hypothetical protein